MDLKIPPMLLAAVFAALMFLVAKLLPGDPFFLPFKRSLIVVFVVAGVAIAVIGVATFHQKGTTVNPTRPSNASSLVINSVYRISRNPMYLGALMLLIAWGIHLGNLLVLIASPATFVIYMNRFQIGPEEKAMQKLFGDEFLSYMKKVRRWI